MHRRLFGWLGPSYVLQNLETIPPDSCRMYPRIHSKTSTTLYEDIKKHRSFSGSFKGKGARIINQHQRGVHGESSPDPIWMQYSELSDIFDSKAKVL